MAVLWSELFPTRVSFAIFIGYIALFVGQGIFVTASQSSNGERYAYNTSVAVLVTEMLKLVMSVGLYLRTNTLRSLVSSIMQTTDLLKFYMVPSILYCVYNNLAFVNLLKFDPTTYYILLQFRVVVTGVIFQIVFRKKLSNVQWFSLILLTIGCIVNRLDFHALFGSGTSSVAFRLDPFMLLILLQAVCSCLAGVYNEYILKHKGADVNIFVQNTYMYVDSIVANACFIGAAALFGGDEPGAKKADDPSALFSSILRPAILVVMLNNACIGIVTSFFLKYLNSILKTFASALELFFTALLCYVLFGIAITLNTVISICIVSLAIYFYSQAPVNNTNAPKVRDVQHKQPLLEGDDDTDAENV